MKGPWKRDEGIKPRLLIVFPLRESGCGNPPWEWSFGWLHRFSMSVSIYLRINGSIFRFDQHGFFVKPPLSWWNHRFFPVKSPFSPGKSPFSSMKPTFFPVIRFNQNWTMGSFRFWFAEASGKAPAKCTRSVGSCTAAPVLCWPSVPPRRRRC